MEPVFAAGKNRRGVRARSLLCCWAVRECGVTMTWPANKLDISVAAVRQTVKSREKIAAAAGCELPQTE